MDPTAILADLASSLGLPDGATPEQIQEAVMAVASLAKAAEGSGPPPAADEAAAKAPAEDAVKATVEVEAAEMPPAEAVDGDAGAFVAMLAEQTGMDAASVLSALMEYMDQIASMIAGAPDDGEMQPEAGSELSRQAADARVQAVTAQLSRRDQVVKDLQSQLAEMQAGLDAREIDDAVGAGAILEQHRPIFVALSRSDREEFRRQLEAARTTPAIPSGTVAAKRGSPPNARDVSLAPQGKHEERLVAMLKKAGVSEQKIQNELASRREA